MIGQIIRVALDLNSDSILVHLHGFFSDNDWMRIDNRGENGLVWIRQRDLRYGPLLDPDYLRQDVLFLSRKHLHNARVQPRTEFHLMAYAVGAQLCSAGNKHLPLI